MYRTVKKIIRSIVGSLLLAVLLFCAADRAEASEVEVFQRDYIKTVYDSDQGLEGSAANCIYAAANGVLWIGSYTGLFSYDSHEFVSYRIGDFPMSVNALTQDDRRNLWIGTNGNGLYYYTPEEEFRQCRISSTRNLALSISRICVDSDDNLWIATKAGLFFVDTSAEEFQAQLVDEGFQEEIRDLTLLTDGRLIAVTRSGQVLQVEDGTLQEIPLPVMEEEVKIRCAGAADRGGYYLGTNDRQIYQMSAGGKVLVVIDGGDLRSFNRICQYEPGQFWVCSDNGIGLLVNGKLEPAEFPLDNSVEDMCRDYQGNYWFASSRQGLLHIYENYFSDLGSYLNIRQTVNSMELWENLLYVGTDDGLLCFRGREPVTEDPLTELCSGQRIRQVYRDTKDALWVVTYRKGLVRRDADGTISVIDASNSGLSTNEIRCIYECADGNFLAGTEAGICTIDQNGTVGRLVEDYGFNQERILTIAEGREGIIFAGTDGDGLYVIRNGVITANISSAEGLYSNVILKIRPSLKREGIWVVTGAGICFVDSEENVSRSAGITIANSLDLVFLNQEEVAVLAGNGFFRMKEDYLLTGEGSYLQLDKRLGLPVDFTANAWNQVRDGVLYLCGTGGAASLEIDKEKSARQVRIYINKVEEDGRLVPNRGKDTVIDEHTHRLNLDFRLLNYTHEEFRIGYFLEGTDREMTYMDESENTNISYTNLKGGTYAYQFAVLDPDTGKLLTEKTITMRKQPQIWEETYIRLLLVLLIVCVLAFVIYLLIIRRDQRIRERYRRRFQDKKKAELEKVSHKDLVTGAGNRNLYEMEKKKLDMDRVYALVTVSVNHAEYIRSKKGLVFYEDILKKTVELMEECAGRPIQIYRISEYIFCFWVEEQLDLELYTAFLKEAFRETWRDDPDVSELAVGAVYHDKLMQETYRDMFRRCDDMRTLDQSHEEMKFMERKIQYINTDIQ